MRLIRLLLLSLVIALPAAAFDLPGIDGDAASYARTVQQRRPAGGTVQQRRDAEQRAEAARRRNDWAAAATALAYYGLAGEYAADGAAGPGSFMIRFLDALHSLTMDEVLHGCKIREG